MWYAVQENKNDPWDYGSEDYCIAVEMLREQVIRELTVLMEAVKEERGAHPVCIEEAIRILKENER